MNTVMVRWSSVSGRETTETVMRRTRGDRKSSPSLSASVDRCGAASAWPSERGHPLNRRTAGCRLTYSSGRGNRGAPPGGLPQSCQRITSSFVRPRRLGCCPDRGDFDRNGARIERLHKPQRDANSGRHVRCAVGRQDCRHGRQWSASRIGIGAKKRGQRGVEDLRVADLSPGTVAASGDAHPSIRQKGRGAVEAAERGRTGHDVRATYLTYFAVKTPRDRRSNK